MPLPRLRDGGGDWQAGLNCTCSVEGAVVLDGEALVKVPSKVAP